MTVTVEALRKAVEGLHGGSATFERFEHVREVHDGDVAWEGDVAVFSLEEHRPASKAYAWAEPIPDSARMRFFVVLHADPVRSPADAVRASILKDARDMHENGG